MHKKSCKFIFCMLSYNYRQGEDKKVNWIDGICEALDYIEDNLTEDITIEEIAKRACVSSFYFQKAFSMLCGFTVGEYIRSRRLALAGSELAATDIKVIDLAVKYCYDSPDSFTRAFTRFHGVTPSAVRKNGAMIKSYAPLKLNFTLEGGFIMDYKIVEKEAFTVVGVSKDFKNETAMAEIPGFWTEHCKSDKSKSVCGMYGICIDDGSVPDGFEYVIADNYIPWNDIPEGIKAYSIPKNTWAVFPCKGPMPHSLQSVNKKIFSEWLPNCKEYEIAGGYKIEMYTPCSDYPKGNLDENYYSEIWIPVKKK